MAAFLSRSGRPAPRAKAHPFGQRFAHHQHFGDGFRRDQADQPAAGVDHADRGRRLFLQHAERLVERAAVADERQRAGHRFRHPGVGAALLDGADQIVAAEHADRMAGGVDHREFALAGPQQGLDRLVDRRVGRKRGELGDHRGAERHAARHGAHRHQLRLRGRGEIDEDRDEDQQRIAEQADEAQREGGELPDGRGDLGGAHVAQAARQGRPQHPAAVHRKRRDHVEQHQEHVHGGEPVEHADGGIIDAGEVAAVDRGAEQQHQRGRDHDVDRRARHRHQELLPGLFGDALEVRHAADRQQRHRRRGHAKAARHENVAELVRHHATEQQQHESKRVERRFGAAGGVAGKENPAQKQQERDVQADDRAGDRADIDRPTHDEPR